MLHILIRSAPNLAQINTVSFLTLICNYFFETIVENKMVRFAMRRTDDHEMPVYLSISYTFVGVQSTFMAADDIHKFNVFGNSDVRTLTDHGRPLPFRHSVVPVVLHFFSSQSTLVLAQFFPRNSLNKRHELQFFPDKALVSARSSLLILLILNKTKKNCYLFG